MAGFLYFAPGDIATVSNSQANQWGLGHVAGRDGSLTCRQVSASIGSGCVFALADDHRGAVKFDADKQTWRKIPEKFTTRELWIGWWNDDRPGVSDLARKNQLPGRMVELLNGERWLVPLLRKWENEDKVRWRTVLPTVIDFNDDGDLVVGDVAPQYRQVWDKSLPIAQQLCFGTEGVAYDDVIALAGPLLGLNYRVSIVEVVILGLISTHEAKTIIDAALDIETFEELLKNLQSRLTSGGMISQYGDDQQATETQPTTGQQLVS